MKNKKVIKLKKAKACKGKKGGCYWDGEPIGIHKLKIAA